MAAAIRARRPWQQGFDLGPLLVGQMDAASGNENHVRPECYSKCRSRTSTGFWISEVMKWVPIKKVATRRQVDRFTVFGWQGP